MGDELYFLPWLRRGLGLTLTNRDPANGPLPRDAPIPAWVQIEGEAEPIDAPLALRPADHATAIDLAQIVRRTPTPSSADAEWGYFPLADLSAPDLPWVLSPATPDEAPGDRTSTGRLRPWLVLVCVEEEAATFAAGSDGRPARLVAPTTQLPDLAESYAWAHVQSAFQPSAVVGTLATEPAATVARLVCPRRLAPNTSYRAALVAAFKAVSDNLEPAWSADDETAELVVYDSWTFRTSDAASFEELCHRLGPVPDTDFIVGVQQTDLTDLGSIEPWPAGTGTGTVDYRGALWDADVRPDNLGPLADDFANPLRKMLDRNELHPTIQPDDPDPVVAPPFYGSYASGADHVPVFGWMPALNLAPAPRMAAGLGAEVVRRNQERFMALAWQQAGQIREASRELSFTRLQGEVGATWKRRIDRLDAHERVAVTRDQLTFIRDDLGHAPRALLRDSSFPNALVSPVYQRIIRPGFVTSKAGARRNPEHPSWHGSMGTTFGSPRSRRVTGFGKTVRPHGLRLADPRHHAEPAANTDVDTDAAGDFSLSSTATLASEVIAPTAAGLARLTARIPALAEAVDGSEAPDTPTRVTMGPAIDEALMWSVVEMSPELLLPGVETFPNNAVRMVEANSAYVASFMAGANHEMIRELLWREFPADLASTTFRRFWDRPDRTLTDIDPIADWPRLKLLEQLGRAGGESVVLLVRGDLVRHYPTVRVLLIDPTTNVGQLPAFGGWIPPDVRFMGFDVADADAVTAAGSQWQVAFEEHPTEARFGLDTIPDGEEVPALDSWDQLSWQQLIGQDDATHLMIGEEFPSTSAPPDGAIWGLNSAHMARVTYQRRYRQVFFVRDLIGR
jgi:hypothetical protein